MIPLSVIQQEKKNFQGFSPELILITQVGEEKLSPSQFLVLRPTSEVVFCHYFRQVLNSYRDLPILVNQ
ncbi:MAG: hypothetical protein QJQ54_03245 [Mollicutes bacterium]|nr:MAG: hypothetical protein QJQ54_03245 [Mollicutes bacterium]